MNTSSTRARLLATSALAAASVLAISAAPAWAADPTSSTSSTDASQATGVTEIVVTGSHIPKPNLDQPTPVEVVPQQIIVDSATPELGAIIAQLPAMSAQGTVRSNANSFGSAGGLDFADLRNLGTSRTLVLVDGQRHVPGDPSSEAVDLSSIPPALVDRIEVVTGGASAIYGSDALAGVINIILKKRFDGVQVDFETGALEPGSAGTNYNLDFTVGHNLANGKGNITVTGIYDHQQSVVAKDIPALKNYGIVVNPNDETAPGSDVPIPNDGKPDFIIVPNVLSNFISETGVGVDFGGNILTTFNAAGQPIPQTPSALFNSFAFGSFPNGCSTCFDLEKYEDIIPKTDRAGADLRADYEVLPNVRFSIDAKYVRNEVIDFVQPSFTFFQDVVTPDNAFITPAIAASLNPALTNDGAVLLDRFLADLGDRTNDITRETYRVVTGFDGTVDAKFADVTWSATYNYGTTRNKIVASGSRISGNFEAALDSVIDPVTGKPACRINVPSAQPGGFTPPAGVINGAACVPYNPFGFQNSQAAINYVTTPLTEHEVLVQQVGDLNASFDTSRFLNLPGGPIGVAVGGEWRQESLSDVQDPLVVQGLTEVAQTPNAAGGFHVYEGYIEANLPFIRHQFLADEVSLDAAYRIADYSTVGVVDAWKVTGIYAPIADVKFRGTYSKAVRAPNLTEAFLPPSGTFFTVNDPCDITNINSNSNFAGNCAAQGLPAVFHSNTNSSPPGVVTGNPNLSPERSTSYTLGFVAQPHQIPNLSITVDYYNIQIQNAIIEPSAQTIVNNCYQSAALDPAFCNLFTRDPVTHNINFITDTFINASALKTDGIETQINYSTDVGPWTQHWGALSKIDGRLNANLDLNWLHRLRDFQFQNDPTNVSILEGEIGFPEFKALATLSYSQGPWQIDFSTNFLSEVDRYSKSTGAQDPADAISPLFVGEQFYDNIVLHYHLTTPSVKADLFVGVNDLNGNNLPEDVLAGNSGGPDGSAAYDLGREFFAGVKANF